MESVDQERTSRLHFSEVLTSVTELRAVLGEPSHRVKSKLVTSLDGLARAFIAEASFAVIASTDRAGRMDVSPKGDPPGFVAVLDDHTLAIPDRPGNRRADTFCNVLEDSRVGLILMVPGKSETLRIDGTAVVVRDISLRERLRVGASVPDLVLVVQVREVMFHCGKCVTRSNLWTPSKWPDASGLPSLAEAMVHQGRLRESVEEMQQLIDRDAATRLY